MKHFQSQKTAAFYPEYEPGANGEDNTMSEAEIAQEVYAIVSDECKKGMCSYVQFVLVALRFRERTGRRLKDAVAEMLGCSSEIPALALNFVRNHVPGLTFLEREGKLFIGLRVAPNAVHPTQPPSPRTAPPPSRIVPQVLRQETREPDITVKSNVTLERFAYVEYETVLSTIADYAEDEAWGDNYWILKLRLRALFTWVYKRWSEASQEERGRYLRIEHDCVVMPLGLYDKGGAEMFLIFTLNRRLSPKWYLNGDGVAAPSMRIAAQGNARLRVIGELPQWPIFPRLIKPTVNDLQLDTDVILFRLIAQLRTIENDALLLALCQVDAPVLAQPCDMALAARARRRATNTPAQEKGAYLDETQAFQFLSACFRRSIAAQDALVARINGALDHLRRNLKSRPDLPVPAYDQQLDAATSEAYIDFLLPFALDGIAPSIALAFCQKENASIYTPKVCLSLSQAYSMARVIGRPESMWLSACNA